MSGADFTILRYAQCWEDADVLLEALQVQPGDTCVSVASGGDNTLALLTRSPGRVIAIDASPAQLACLELRAASYRALEHGEMLRLTGSRPGDDRRALYARCRPFLSDDARRFWDARPASIERGFSGAGKFENYFRLFRTRVLPLVHRRRVVEMLLEPKEPDEREAFFRDVWNNRRWRWMFRVFFSRAVMGRAGRDPAFFRHVEGSVSGRIAKRARHAMTRLEPAENPYLHWILRGAHASALPCALRPENFETIRDSLDRLEWRAQTVQDFLRSREPASVDRFNLSDVFEYMSAEEYRHVLDDLLHASRPGARLVYWNLLVPRRRPDALAGRLRPLDGLARSLHARDRAFFYDDLVVEEVIAR